MKPLIILAAIIAACLLIATVRVVFDAQVGSWIEKVQ